MNLSIQSKLFGLATLALSVTACSIGDADGWARAGQEASQEASQERAPATEIVEIAPTPAAPASSPPVAPPAGKSTVPTLEEFENAPGETTVNGSGALGCQTKAVREWSRISCRGTDPQRGKPTGLTVQNKNGKEVLTAVLPDRTSLVYRFEPGTKVEATFTWTRLTKKFVSEWPAGAPKPTAYGRFF